MLKDGVDRDGTVNWSAVT
uniref:Uncharacterized protein n=1 Tax=Anguilla anguilla TaxID=7936 RepID=A0A0E9XRE3_ANGAN